MRAVSYLPPPPPSCHRLLHNSLKPPPPTTLALFASAKSPPPEHDLGGLGKSILTELKSNPKTINPVTPKQKQEEGKQIISGSDVLFAMQRAAVKKNREIGKKKKKKQGGQVSSSSSVGGRSKEEAVDYGKVRPLVVKSEWGRRLDELEKRLEELSSKTI